MSKTNRTLIWVWIVSVFAVYAYQFRDFAAPILNILGLR
jgi:hypothetical protein